VLLFLRFQELYNSFPKRLWRFRNYPVSCVNIRQLKPRKETSNDGKRFIGDVFTAGASNEKGGLLETYFFGIFVWEIT